MGSTSILLHLCIAGYALTVQANPSTTSSAPFGVLGHHGAPPEEYDSVAYCNPYCDKYGYYEPGKWCVSQDDSVEVFCCGDENMRFCCADPDKELDNNENVAANSCPNSSWWYYQWRVIVGLLATLVVMLLFAACCYYCCGGSRRNYARRGANRFFSRQTHPDEEQTPPDNTFDPESQYAFRPPEYSLPKDPPKYADIIDGVDNAGFTTSPETLAQEGTSQPSGENSTPGQSETTGDSIVVEPSVSPSGNLPVSVSTPVCPPPVYEEIDSNAPQTDNQTARASGQNGNHAPVHVSRSQNNSTPLSLTSNSSRHSSVTSHGAVNEPSSSTLPEVEGSLPPPYDEIRSITPSLPPQAMTSNCKGV